MQLGRIYSAATREGNIVTLFDETALANDIRAVTANATQTTVPVSALNSSAALATSIDERINALECALADALSMIAGDVLPSDLAETNAEFRKLYKVL